MLLVLASWLAGPEAHAQAPFFLPDPLVEQVRAPATGRFALELRSVQVRTKITGASATTQLDQVFFNPGQRSFEGYYYYPLPPGSSIGKFTMYINGQETPGELLDAKKAKEIYEDILRRRKDPALLEYLGRDLLRVRIFPVPARATQRVVLHYTHSLIRENGTTEYVLPFQQGGEKLRPIGRVGIAIELESTAPLKNIYCPTHKLEITRIDDHHATLGFEGEQVKPEHDLKLYFSSNKAELDLSLLDFRQEGEEGFFFLNLSPGLAKRAAVIDKDITFVLDASGSMAGEKMAQAQRALSFCINNLNRGDRFNIVRFSTEASALFPQLEAATTTKMAEAERYLQSLKAIGGTNIEEALELALGGDRASERPHFVVFLTDGKPTIGETGTAPLLAKVKSQNPDQTRIFTFGIGSKLNTHLLDQLTQMTNAYRTYVEPSEDIEVKVSDFFTKVSSPILTDLEIEFSSDLGVSEVYPKQLPELFKGNTLNLLGRYRGSGKGQVILRGKVNGKPVRYAYPVTLQSKATTYDFIPPLWATRVVGYLLEQIRLQGQEQELVDEVVRLSKQYGIITPYTSYLILEDEQQLIGQGQLRPEETLFFGNQTQGAQKFREEISTEYEISMNKVAGVESVRASEEVQTMNQNQYLSQARTGESRLQYHDQQGKQRNWTDDLRYVAGRASYRQGEQWIDANTQLSANRSLRVRRIQFNSTAYRRFVEENPDQMDFLALGRNVRFVNRGEIIEIYE